MKISADTKSLAKLIKQLFGRNDLLLTLEEVAYLKAKNTAALAAYQALRKEHNAASRALLSQLVGTKKVKYEKVLAALVKGGFKRSLVPGFTGEIDAKGKLYFKGEVLNATPNVTTYSHIEMNDGAGDFVAKAYKHLGGVAHLYTTAFTKQRSAEKFVKVANTSAIIDKLRKKWLAKVKKFDVTDPSSVASLVLELLYTNAARIGTEPGRGLGTILKKNVEVTPTKIIIAYSGKDSIPTKHIITKTSIEGMWVFEAVKELYELAIDKNSHFFTAHTLRPFKVTPAIVNKQFRTIGAPAGVTVHKLRTVRGTTMFGHLIIADEAMPLPATKKEAMLRYQDMVTQVGELLNHRRGVGTATEKVTGATAAKSYIDLAPQLALFDRWGYEPPAILSKLK